MATPRKKPAKKAPIKEFPPNRRKAKSKPMSSQPPAPTRKKAAIRKSPAGKPAARPSKGKPVPVEIVDEPRELVTPEVEQELRRIEEILTKSEAMGTGKLLEAIQARSRRAEEFAGSALNSAALALANAWACGKLLLAAKEKLGRGDFGQWRDKNLAPARIGERTTQRYMRLAEVFTDVRDLLAWSPTLRQAYIACGILPAPELGDGAGDDKGSPRTRALLAGISGLQKRLRLFESSGEKLGAGERRQLQLVRSQLDEFFNRIFG